MLVRQFLDRIEKMAPLASQESWDKGGIQVAGEKTMVNKLAVTLDPLPEIVKSALKWDADFILAHHPMTLNPRPLDKLDGYRTVFKFMLASGSWLYSAHTSLDCRPDGPAGWLADTLGLEQRTVLAPTAEVLKDGLRPQPGYGIIGNLPEPMSPEKFHRVLSSRIKRSYWTLSGPAPEQVSRVAYCPGSGASLIKTAFLDGADVFITGDVKYHEAQDAPGLVIDVGHFTLEEEMMRIFSTQLAEELEPDGVEVRFFQGNEPLRLLVHNGA